jgi:hypothetical protein
MKEGTTSGGARVQSAIQAAVLNRPHTATFTFTFLPQRKEPRYPLNRRLDRHHSSMYGQFGEEKNLMPLLET